MSETVFVNCPSCDETFTGPRNKSGKWSDNHFFTVGHDANAPMAVKVKSAENLWGLL